MKTIDVELIITAAVIIIILLLEKLTKSIEYKGDLYNENPGQRDDNRESTY